MSSTLNRMTDDFPQLPPRPEPVLKVMALDDLLREARPFIFHYHPWEDVFSLFENRERDSDPIFWQRFMETVKECGIPEPIWIREWFGVLYVVRGEYSLWAAWRMGLPEVPCIFDYESPQTGPP